MNVVSKGKKKCSIKRFFKSFTYAFSGLKSAIKTEQNLWFDIIVGLLAIILGFLLKISTIEFLIVLLTIGLVISLELINTAIEYTVNLVTLEIHPLAKSAKDISAGGVLFSAFIAIIIGIIIFLPKIINLL